jgi:CRISPR-associated protein Csx17
MPDLILSGCSPVPLAHYLKALAILRIVAESSPERAGTTAAWAADQLVLNSHFDADTLVAFFLNDYRPTAVLAPWNGGSGFYRSDKRIAIDAIQDSKTGRFNGYKDAILLARLVLAKQLTNGRKTSRYRSQVKSTLRKVNRQTFDSIAKSVLKGLASKKPLKKPDAISDLVLDLAKDSAVIAKINGQEVTSKQLLAFWKVAGYKDKKGVVTRIKDSEAFCEDARGSREKALSKLLDVELSDTKAILLADCRNTFPEDALDWLDAVFVLGQDGAKFPPLLGTGGNDGRLEFTNNFMQRIIEVIDPATGAPTADSERWLRAALFGTPAPGLAAKAPIGQFFPGAAGGANGTSGFDAPSAVNPWDFILMIEGALLFAAASVRRLESVDGGLFIYPFCVRQAGVGYASAAGSDEKDARCEMWMPLWNTPTTLPELRAIFSEGRAQVRGRAARSGVDFAQAAVTLGVDRGIAAFQRYGFQVRNGLSYFATPLERVIVRRNARADLLADVEHWHDRLRQKAGPTQDAPASVARALNLLERRIVELCREDSTASSQAVIAALGNAERALAKSLKWTTESAYLRPLHGLKPQWLTDADDGSTEFRLAASLAGMRAWLGGKETLYFRQHLEPLEMGANKERSWASWDKTPRNDVVWHDGDLTDSLNAILARRLIRVENSGARGWPDFSPCFAKLADITAFIERRTNDALLADLIWGLSLIDWQTVAHQQHEARIRGRERVSDTAEHLPNGSRDDEQHAIPSAFYALLRLCFRAARGDDVIPLHPAILNRAMSGNGTAASELASRRLRASGNAPLVASLPVRGDIGRRTAAAMLFPISNRDLHLLEHMILKKQNQQNT